MKKWEYVGAIEEMAPEKLRARIKAAMDYRITEEIQPIPYVAEERQVVEYVCAELTAKCPMTGLRDFYKITIKFVPDKLLPELKTLRKYYAAYDELPISHEHLAAKIYRDFNEIVKPKELHLELDTAVRGGIKTVVRLGGSPTLAAGI